MLEPCAVAASGSILELVLMIGRTATVAMALLAATVTVVSRLLHVVDDPVRNGSVMEAQDLCNRHKVARSRVMKTWTLSAVAAVVS